MFAGPGWGWAWSLLNGAAVGSPTRRKEAAWVTCGLLGSMVLILMLDSLAQRGVLSDGGVRYCLVGLTVWKLAVSYWLYVTQTRSFRLYEYFGGRVRNGIFGVIAGFFLAPKIYAALPVLFQLTLSNF